MLKKIIKINKMKNKNKMIFNKNNKYKIWLENISLLYNKGT